MADTIFQGLAEGGDRIAVIGQSGERLTFGELTERADALGGRLPGRCLVLVVCTNCAECVIGYVGLMRAGAAVILVHAGMKPGHLEDIVRRFRPAFAFAPAGTMAGEDVASLGEYRLVKTGHAIGAVPLHDDLRLLLATSGTTGSRQFVRLSAANVAGNAGSISRYLGIDDQSRAITTMPMSYSYGLSILHSHLLSGGSVVMVEAPLVSPVFWKAVREHEATTFGGVPFIYEMLKRLNFERMNLPSLRTLTQAGGRLSRDLILHFVEVCESKGIEFIVMYGQTEATARISYVPWEKAREKAGSIGIAIPDGSLALLGEDGEEIDEAAVSGELVYRGPNVSMGYAVDHGDLGRGDENRGRLLTGDIAVRDADGIYSIVGRKKRFLKLYGNRVNLDEVEQILKSAGYVCACVGSDDRLVVYAQPPAEATAVKDVLAAEISINPRAISIELIDVIPRSESGKVDYGVLRGAA